MKRARAAEFVGFAGGLFSAIPTPIWAAIGPVASQLPLSLCNIICTNIPGPQVPLYLLGHKMLSWYPYVPIGGEMGLNCAILSYNGMAYFGFICDVGAVPDPEHLEKFVELSFAELSRSAKHVKPQAEQETQVAAPVSVERPRHGRVGRMIPLGGPAARETRLHRKKLKSKANGAARNTSAAPVSSLEPIPRSVEPIPPQPSIPEAMPKPATSKLPLRELPEAVGA